MCENGGRIGYSHHYGDPCITAKEMPQKGNVRWGRGGGVRGLGRTVNMDLSLGLSVGTCFLLELYFWSWWV